MAQIENPCKGDFAEMIRKDFDLVEVPYDIELVTAATKQQFKKLIKNRIKQSAFKYLKEMQAVHTKAKNIKYEKLEIQKYLISPLFSDAETKLLFGLRSQTSEYFKLNFKYLYREHLECPLNCCDPMQMPNQDSQ